MSIDGYYKDYYLNNKYMGSRFHGNEPDRDICGFMGRKNEVLTDEIKLDNNRILKINITYQTELQIICKK